jgi:8-oxo-dGTP diphosphatase
MASAMLAKSLANSSSGMATAAAMARQNVGDGCVAKVVYRKTPVRNLVQSRKAVRPMNVLEEAEPAVDISLAAAIVVHRDRAGRDRVLVIRRSVEEKFLPRRWGVPCGKVENFEEPREAAVRELREETGLTGEVVREVGTLGFSSEWQGRSARNIQFNYLMRLTHAGAKMDDGMPTVKMPRKDQRAKWLTLTEIGAADLDEHNREAISQALQGHGLENL